MPNEIFQDNAQVIIYRALGRAFPQDNEAVITHGVPTLPEATTQVPAPALATVIDASAPVSSKAPRKAGKHDETPLGQE